MPEPIATALPIPQHAPADESPGLVQSDGPITMLGLVEASPSLSELARDCVDKVLGGVVDVAGNTNQGAVVTLASLKAGLELMECYTDSVRDESVSATIIECTKRGGTPVGVLEHSVSCQGMKR
jgi:hypothetical protein